MSKELSQDDLWTLRAIVQKSGWKGFMNHVGSLMAEQADKVESGYKQDSALAFVSQFIHGNPRQELWDECGTFDYLNSCFFPKEYKEMFEARLNGVD